MNAIKNIFLYLFIVALLFSVQACFKQIVETKGPLPDIIWPEPPEIPRIRLVNSISTPQDLNIRTGRFERFFMFLKGARSGAIVNPYGIAKDREGRLYVVDTFSRTVHVFDTVKGKYYTFPDTKTALTSPIDIAVDNKGTVYVSDSTEAVIKTFSPGGGKFISEIGRGLLNRPTGIAFNQVTGELLVVDTKNSEIVRYDTETNTVKGIIGKEGSVKGLFYNPTNIFVSRTGRVIVSDSLNFRIQILESDGSFIRSFGGPGDSPGFFARPRGVAADSEGNIYVVDALFDNIQIFNEEGTLLMDFGRSGSAFGEFWLPSGIFIDEFDTIYVADSYNQRVQVFQYLKENEFNAERKTGAGYE